MARGHPRADTHGVPGDAMIPAALRAAILQCHAPIVIPAIGASQAHACAASTAAMREAAYHVVRSGATTVLLVSPHTPRRLSAFSFFAGGNLRGDFHAFGVHGLDAAFPGDAEACRAVARSAAEGGISLEPLNASLDHGALVPLWFLREAGYQGTVAVFGFPGHGNSRHCRAFGGALARAMAALDRPWAFIASGDMSHALAPGAPGGFHPRADEFDRAVVDRVQAGRLGDVSAISPQLQDLAAQDVTEALDVAAGLLGPESAETRVLSYEAPFGVGYLVALLHGELS